LSHRAWKSRPKRGIPTSPQPRRRRVINTQPDNSLTTKTGPFNLLRTGESFPAAKSALLTSLARARDRCCGFASDGPLVRGIAAGVDERE
ncbi:MAG TPA: hypothetical protein VN875_01935, partial [Candidatus Binatus sp.]|nr:hypothetical protein [Candidatus Binatus sp.]